MASMADSLDSVLISKKTNTNSLAYKLFDSSYDKQIAINTKNDAFYQINNNIHQIISDLDLSFNDEKLLHELNNRILKSVSYGANKIYSRDFSNLNPTTNCVGYADIMVTALSMLDRADLLKNASIKFNKQHVWMEFNLDNKIFEFNKKYQYSDYETKNVEYLTVLNQNSLVNEFIRKNDYSSAEKYLRKINGYKDDYELSKKNLEFLYEQSTPRSFIDPQCNSCNTASGRRCLCPCPIRQLAAIVGRDDSVWGAFCLLCLHSS